MRQFKAPGFTLIELILVTGILAIFAVGLMAIINPSSQIFKANDARRKSDLAQIQRALEAYYQDNGRYPSSSSNHIFTTVQINWGSSWEPYMSVVPKDPSASRNYVYFASSDGQSYVLYASLEKGTDAQACNGGNPCKSLNGATVPGNSMIIPVTTNACGGTCNYGVASPDITP
ncbi:MAG TPA: type II secretion system protein GspG [Patescibacteria group bacterium]|nr:type II secretion system protein GspG [Patescibacteria group bacterium]